MTTIAATEELRKQCLEIAGEFSKTPYSTKLLNGAFVEVVNDIAKKLPPGQAARLLQDVHRTLQAYAAYKANRKPKARKRLKGVG